MNTTVVEAEAPPAQASAPPARLRPPSMTPDVAVEKFVALRDKVAAVKKRHTEELAPFNVALATLEAWLLDDLNNAHVDQMKAAAGTFYKSTRTSATVNRWSDTLAYIQENDAWELLEARVSKAAVEAIMEETKQPVPGVAVRRETVLNVRRA